MSLLCSECEQPLAPSNILPGREGTLVYPTLLSQVWHLDKFGEIDWSHDYYIKPGEGWVSLCFECIGGSMPQKRMAVLERIYELYKLEIECRQIYRKYGHTDYLNWAKLVKVSAFEENQIYKEFLEKIGEFGRKGNASHCIFCGVKDEDGENPYMSVKVIDKIFAQEPHEAFDCVSSTPAEFLEYSSNHVNSGIVSFPICFKCFRNYFNSSFSNLTSIMGNNAKTEATLVVSSEVIAQLKNKLSPEEYRLYIQEIKKFTRLSGMNINVSFPNDYSNN